MTSSVLSVELVNVEYDRMKDCPAQRSNLTRRPVIWIRGTVPLNAFLSTETMLTVPGLRSIFICSEMFAVRDGTIIAPPIPPRPGVMPAALMDSMSSARIPQPIWYPASRVPPVSFVLPPPVIEPVNVPSTRYSRDAAKPVSGATGSMDSFTPVTFKVQPSGVLKIPGGPEGTGPLGPPGGGGAVSAAGTTGAGSGGSANASGAAPVGTSMQTAAKVAKRFNMSRWRLSSCESPRDRQDLSRGIFDRPSVQTVNGRTTVETPCLSSRHLQQWQPLSKRRSGDIGWRRSATVEAVSEGPAECPKERGPPERVGRNHTARGVLVYTPLTTPFVGVTARPIQRRK